MPVAMEPDFVVCPRGRLKARDGGPGPDDVAHFVPQGLALAAPMVVTPYGGPAAPSFYSAQGTITHPVRSAPINDDAGGVVYFPRHVDPAHIVSALEHFGFRSLETSYALFIASAENPQEEGFLDQMRIVSLPALAHFYGIEIGGLTPQARNAGEAVQRFMAWQIDTWEGAGERSLAGVLGGDGDWAKERLAFGAMTENAYWGVWRIWSRAWLVTK